MARSRAPQIREILKGYPNGITALDMSKLLHCGRDTVRNTMIAMPDVYIDRWEKGGMGPYAAVFIGVEVPDDCPYPAPRSIIKRRKPYAMEEK